MSAVVKNDVSDLINREKVLLQKAKDAATNAYNPYSKFLVGAAVETISGNIYSGTFIENASFGLTICAEPSAIMAANNAGDRDIRSIAIVGGTSLNSGGNFVTPCGRCRQIIYEFSQLVGRDIDIYCSNMNFSSIVITSINHLLPLPFGPENFVQDE